MESFVLFDIENERVTFHAEFCNETCVHTMDGKVLDTEKLLSCLGVQNIKDGVKKLTKDFSSQGFFDFLREKEIPFKIDNKEYCDTSSDV